MDCDIYEEKSPEQRRAEAREGLLFVALLFAFVLGIGPGLRALVAWLG